jgi:tetratricopeptide (TPR) repeat protein
MTGPDRPISPRSRAASITALALGLLAVAILAAYHNSLQGPFVFDDLSAIPENATLRALWPPSAPLSPPPSGTTVSGRPMANLTFALNYALSGDDPWSYHVANLLIHILGAAALFGVVRRTLRRPVLKDRFGPEATSLALAIALLWALHPLQTEAVTYVVQRVESLMALFYLLTLYAFIRSVDSPRPGVWKACAWLACLAGMATKEVMATAPVLILLYDRTFVAGTFSGAWRQRRGFYVALAANLLPLAFFVAETGWNRGGSAGFGSPLTAPAYWMTQGVALVRYLGLTFWPHPLVFDYGTWVVASPVTAGVCALLVIGLAGATVFACLRGKWAALGFLGAWFFIILAPSSLVPVATQTMAEHRMYLPLAAVAVLVILGLHALLGARLWLALALLALGLGYLTERRNEVYRSAVSLWSDTVRSEPDNARAHCSLGFALSTTPGGLPVAIEEFEEALRLRPDYPDAENDLGMALGRTPDQTAAAERHFREALKLRPEFAQAHYNLGTVLAREGRIPEAIDEFNAALRDQPEYPEASNNLGNLLCATGHLEEGIQQLENAIRARPLYPRAHYDLANALVQAGRVEDAVGHYETALKLQPAFSEADNNLGMVLCRTGRMAEGIEHIRSALRARPDFPQAHFALGAALLQTGRKAEAEAEYEQVLVLRPNDPAAERMLEMIRRAP